MTAARSFAVTIPDERRDEMRRRIRGMKSPADFVNSGWRYGVEQGLFRDIARYQAEDYDRRDEHPECWVMTYLSEGEQPDRGRYTNIRCWVSWMCDGEIRGCRQHYRPHAIMPLGDWMAG